MPRSGWAREPWPLSLRIRSLCSTTEEATTERGPRTYHRKKKKNSILVLQSNPVWGEVRLRGCTEPSPGHWGELSWTPVPSRPQDKAEAAEGAPRALDTDPSEVEDAAVSAMLHAVAASRLPVCSQQQGEPDLTEQEKVAILGQLYHEKPLVFLERFRTGLREEHLACFGHLRGDHRADFYCAEVAWQGSTRPRTLRTRLRNRRYAALRELIQEGEYFSDEQMRFRAPLLYEQYIGQYLTLEELSARTPAQRPPKPGPPGTPACPLSDLLLQSYQERELRQRLLQQQEEEEACLEEEEEEDSDQEDQRPDKDLEAWVPDSEERLILREEFTSRMHQHFLDGKDGDFDYSTVDDNPDFDNLDIVARDEEERYFDEEEPEDAPSPELDGD
ncbi:coiled-coil domain-containing protein 97 isoform X2 [Monodon monoceros]|uniref:coiled-coil domain-containing protein 97 isoform X2 n=1 Tax=Monodon monoceros TaxID=40151 RepID=UPI0010F6313F|nr:coiled-coil domain-containing protein 97 isoform X2 [Monodon monoceros]